MKKYGKLLIFTFLAFLLTNSNVFAKQMNLEELGEKLDQVDSSLNQVIIIGEYAYTGVINTKDYMMAARSIPGITENYIFDKTNLDKMAIHVIQKEYDDDLNPIGWEIKDNLLGTTNLDANQINIRYIDYEYVPEEATIDVKLQTAENQTQFTEALKTLKFEEGNQKWSESLNLDSNGVLTGNLLRNNTVTSENGYYFAYIITVKGATSNTKLQVGTESIDWSKWQIQGTKDTNSSILLLAKYTPGEQEINITVDLDGDGNAYGDSKYKIDLSQVTYQKESEVKVSSTEVSKNDQENLQSSFGYVKDASKDTYEYHPEAGTLTGTVYEQELTSDIYSQEKTGFYFAFNITPEQITDKLQVTVKNGGNLVKTFSKSDFNGKSYLTMLIAATDACINNREEKMCKVEVSIDIDGNENAYQESTYTMDYSGLSYLHTSKASVEKALEPATTKLASTYGWSSDRYNLTVEEREGIVYFGGFIPKVNLTKENVFGEDKLTGYYLPFVIKTVKDRTQQTKITLTGGKIVGYDEFDTNTEMYVLKSLNKDAETKQATITVDMDGAGESYESYSITYDWSGVEFEEETKATISTEIPEDVKTNMLENRYGYFKDERDNYTLVSGKLTGDIHEHEIQENIFSQEEMKGYYFAFNIKPEKVTEDIVVNLTGTKLNTYHYADFEGKDSLTILFAVGEKCISNPTDASCKLSIEVDSDGENTHYKKSETYEVDYTGLTYKTNHATVNDEDSLTRALNNQDIEIIYIAQDIKLQNTVTINRDVTITTNEGTTMRHFEIETEKKDAVINVVSGKVNISYIHVMDATNGIHVASGANLTADNIHVEGNATAGFLVEGTLTATNVTASDENYNNPVVRAKKGSVVQLKKTDGSDIKATTYQKVVKDAAQNFGDTKTEDQEYVHYYLEENHSKLLKITFRINSPNSLRLDYIRYFEYNTVPEEPSTDIENIYSFNKEELTYVLSGWKKDQGTTYQKGNIPAIQEDDLILVAQYTSQQRDTAALVDSIVNLKNALQDPTKTLIIITQDIDLGTETLEIDHKVGFRGQSREDKNKYKLTGSFDIKADGVGFSNLEIIGKKGNGNTHPSDSEGRYDIIKVEENVKNFYLESSILKNGDLSNKAYSALYLPGDNIVATIRWNTIDATNIYNTIEFGYGKAVGNGTVIYLNNFLGKDNHNHINIYTVQEGAKIQINSNTFAYSGNAIRFSNTTNASATFEISYNNYKETTQEKDYQGFILFQGSGNNDFSKYKIESSFNKGPDGVYLTGESTGIHRFAYYATADGQRVADDNTTLDNGKNADIVFTNEK